MQQFFVSVFKCRLCDEKFGGGMEILYEGTGLVELLPEITSSHRCKNGDLGIADPVGLRKASDEEVAEYKKTRS